MRVVLTGAAGSLAADILPGLVAAGVDVVALDRRVAGDPRVTALGLTWHVGDLTDRAWLETVRPFAGADAVVHLAGIPLEDDWERILAANIDGTQAVLEAARRAGVQRAVLASSVHAVGFVPVPGDATPVADDVRVRPNTYYGVSKAAVEALGSLFHDRYGMDVVCLRIASRFERPRDVRMLTTWLSPADATRLVLAALSPAATGFRTVWGVSANTRTVFSRQGGQSIGFEPGDDAESYAQDILERVGVDPSVGPNPFDTTLGGVFSSPEPPRQPRPSGEAAGQATDGVGGGVAGGAFDRATGEKEDEG